MKLSPLLTLAAMALCLPLTHAQSVFYSESFESGLPNWTATGLWNLESDNDVCGPGAAPFPDGSLCAYYGIDGACHYNTPGGSAGTLTLNSPIVVPAGTPACELHWWQRADVEPCGSGGSIGYDNCRLEMSTNGGTSWFALANSCQEAPPHSGSTEPGVWLPQRASLAAFAGQSVLLRFSFNTLDDLFNDTLGFLIDDIVLRTEVGTAFCTILCPCAPTFPGQFTGCRNSARHFGELAGGGSPSVSADSVVLNAVDLAVPGVALFLQATTFGSPGTVFGDGRFCLTGSQIRIGTKAAPTGVASYPETGDAPISLVGQIPAAGGTRNYQVVYRDTLPWCNPESTNATNGYRIVWLP